MMKEEELVINYIYMIIGTLIMAAGIQLFLVPNQLSTGGFSGLSTILYYITGISVGTIMLVLNIPVFIVALLKLGKRYCLRAIFGTVLLSLFLNLFENVKPLTDDRFLAFIYGSIIVGIGTASVLKANSSTRWFRHACHNNKSF